MTINKVEPYFPSIFFALAGLLFFLIAGFLNTHGMAVQKALSNGAHFDGLVVDLLFVIAALLSLGCLLAAASETIRVKHLICEH